MLTTNIGSGGHSRMKQAQPFSRNKQENDFGLSHHPWAGRANDVGIKQLGRFAENTHVAAYLIVRQKHRGDREF